MVQPRNQSPTPRESPTSREIQSPDQRFLYYVVDYPLDFLPNVVGQLTKGSAFNLEKDSGDGGAFVEISLKSPAHPEIAGGINWYPPTKREPTPEERKAGVRRSTISLVSSGQGVNEILDPDIRINLNSKLRFAEPAHDGLSGLAKQVLPGIGFESWQQTVAEIVAELPFEIEQTNPGKFTIRGSPRMKDGSLTAVCFYGPQVGIKPVRTILRRDETLSDQTAPQWDRILDWPEGTERAKVTLFYQEEEIQSAQVTRNQRLREDLTDSLRDQERPDVPVDQAQTVRRKPELPPLAQRVAAKITFNAGPPYAMATLISPSLAVTTRNINPQSGIPQRLTPSVVIECLGVPPTYTPATLVAVDEIRGFALFELRSPVPPSSFADLLGLRNLPTKGTWQSYFLNLGGEKGTLVQGVLQGQTEVEGGRGLRLVPQHQVDTNLIPRISGAPVIVDHQLIGIVTPGDTEGRFLSVLTVADMAESSETDAVRKLLPAIDLLREPTTNAPTKEQTDDETVESIDLSSISDTPTDKDSLGFKPYVDAISRFLNSSKTKPPLTLSIEGEWGSGKSSFMLQLKNAITMREPLWERLRKSWASNGSTPETLPAPPAVKRSARLWKTLREKPRIAVQFNPWRHDKVESLWAAFALEFLRQVSRQRGLLRRVSANLRLFWAHYSWKRGWLEMVRAAVVWLIMPTLLVGMSIEVFVHKPWWAQELVAAMSEKPDSSQEVTKRFRSQTTTNEAQAQPPDGEEHREKGDSNLDLFLKILLQAGGDAAYLALVLTIWIKAKNIFGNPLEINLKRYLRSPDYEGRVAFVEQFHEDFRKIVDAYAGKERVFVFIDDLDRCDVPKAAELMKAVNLLIADDPRLIFILGMDREKVAAGLAVTHEGLLPYLGSEDADNAQDRQRKRQAGLGFGYDFLQKFIQVPFRVPRPSPENYREFIETISIPTKLNTQPTENPTVQLPGSQPLPKTPGPNLSGQLGVSQQAASTSSPTLAQVQARRQRELQFGGDSDNVRAVALMVADTLGRNPRRLKQFVNLFRLQAYIVNEIGLFDHRPGTKPITLEQLGKFVAITLWWPALLADFGEDPTLLGKLEEFATGDPRTRSAAHDRWLKEPKVQTFMNYGIETRKERYTLSNPLLFQLLHICPQRVKAITPATPSAGPNP